MYTLVDLESLNGTFVNEIRVDREKIYHGDDLIVGKHKLDFVDLRPEEDRPERPVATEVPEMGKFRDTVVLDTKAQQELLEKHAAERGHAQGLPEKPKRVELFGSLTVLAGGVPQIIDLEKRLTVLGKSDEADVRCSGLLVGKTAALINKRPNGFFLSYSEGMKKPEINGEVVATQQQLHDGDEITVGGTRMTFNVREEVQES